MSKFFMLLATVFFLIACSSDENKNIAAVIDEPMVDSPTYILKSIYYKNDFLQDTNLSVTENNVAIYKVNNNTALNEVIPFVIEDEGDYEFCIDGAQNILSVEILDATSTSILISEPKFPLQCISVHLNTQKYMLKLRYIVKINSMYDVEVPYIRLYEKREIKSEVLFTDWESGKLYESDVGSPLYNHFKGFRYCYKTPINANSTISFWRDSNKFRLSFRSNLDEGTTFNCTYPGSALKPQKIYSASDIGDIDSIVSQLLDTQNTPSLVYARPASGSTHIGLDSSINIKFRGSIDALSLSDAYSISPDVAGVLSLEGQNLSFVPTDKLEYMTTYSVSLKGLSDNGVTISDIDLSFTTHERYIYDESKPLLEGYELCAVGLSSYCPSEDYAKVISIQMDYLEGSINGSRTLVVNTTLDKATPVNILIDYELVSDDSANTLLKGTLIVEEGATNGLSEISYDYDTFILAEQNATLNIVNIRNAYTNDRFSFNYIVEGGEFFKTHSEVIAPEIVQINNLSFSNKILTVGLDTTAVEDVDVQIYFVGTPLHREATIKAGTNSIGIALNLTVSVDLVARVNAARNASVLDGLELSFSY